MKIVVPVDNDKKTIFKRTGRAPFFNIYEDLKLVDSMLNSHAQEHDGDHNHSHEHSDEHEHAHDHKKDVQNLVGCDVILAQAVGEHMKEALESINLNIMKLRKDDGVTSEEVVEKFLKNALKNQAKN